MTGSKWLVWRPINFEAKPQSEFASCIDHGPRLLHPPQHRQEIHPDSWRTGSFCMNQYTKCVTSGHLRVFPQIQHIGLWFGRPARRPFNIYICWGLDATRTWSPTKALSPEVRKIVVFVKDRIHASKQSRRTGPRCPFAGIEQRLAEVVGGVRQQEAKGETPPQANILADTKAKPLWTDTGKFLFR